MDGTGFAIADAARVAKEAASLLTKESERNPTVNTLPGAIQSEGKSFDGDSAEHPPRDPNVLPGAIGSKGSFDSYDVSSSTDGDSKALSTQKSSSIRSRRRNRVSPQGVRPQTKKSPSLTSKKAESTAPSKKAKTATKTSADSASKRVSSRPKAKNSSPSSSQEKDTASKDESSPSSVSSSTEQGGDENSNQENQGDTRENINHPMNRNMEELQVSGGTGQLEENEVRATYEKLVKAYLAPFANGIKRSAFFEILRRKTYSLTPPGANKGIQTILFQIIDKHLYFMDPYEVAKNSKAFYKTRLKELIWLLSDIAKGGKVPDTEFLLAIHDCVQTVSSKHSYRGAVYTESSPTFTIVSCNFSDNIPFPMWEGDEVRGGLKSWDEKMVKYGELDQTPWAEKKGQAVFRGGNRPSMFFHKKKDANEHCDEVGRSRLRYLGEKHPELFDIGVSGTCGGKTQALSRLSEAGHHKYKYILYAEGNCFWADRLNKQVFGPSAIIKQETPCGQFWEPLLKPMTHYIPTNFFFQDTVEKLKWAQENDQDVQNIVKNANEFAGNFLSVKGIKTYVEVLLIEYSKLLASSKIVREKGSIDVTV